MKAQKISETLNSSKIEKDAIGEWAELSNKYNGAVRGAEDGLKGLYAMATGEHEGMADAAARDLIRILSNTLLALNGPKASSGKKAVWGGKGPNPCPDLCSDAVWPAVFARLARKRDSWPVLFYVHPERQDHLTISAIEGFAVGAEKGINVGGKSFSLLKPANIAVLNIMSFIEGYRGREFRGELSLFNGTQMVTTEQSPKLRSIIQSLAGLPTLSRDPAVLNSWQKAGSRLLPFLYGENFEKNSALVSLVGKKTETGDSVLERKPKRYWQRAQVQRAIKDAWESVAAYA